MMTLKSACNLTNCTTDDSFGLFKEDHGGHPSVPRIPEALRIIIMLILPIVCVIGLIGNTLVMWMFCRTKSLRTPQNIMIINLAISDFILTLTLPPIMFVSVVNRYFYFGEIGCQFDAFCGCFFGIASISNLTVIAIDRCYSLERFNSITYGRAFFMAAIVWIYSLLWAILPFIGIGEYVLEGYHVSCTFQYLKQSRSNKVYVGLLYCGSFAFPVSVIGICYWKMYCKVKATRKSLAEATVSDIPCASGVGVYHDGRKSGTLVVDAKQLKTSNGWRGQKLEVQVARIGAILTILFVVSWTPYATVALIGQYINPDLVTPLSQTIPVVIAKCAAAWDPFVYAIKHTGFRSAIRERIGRKTARGRKLGLNGHGSKVKLGFSRDWTSGSKSSRSQDFGGRGGDYEEIVQVRGKTEKSINCCP